MITCRHKPLRRSLRTALLVGAGVFLFAVPATADAADSPTDTQQVVMLSSPEMPMDTHLQVSVSQPRTFDPAATARVVLTVRNTGGQAARQVQACDQLPAALLVVKAPSAATQTGNRVCWQQDSQPQQSVRRVSLTVAVDAGTHRRQMRLLHSLTVRALNAPTARQQTSFHSVLRAATIK